MLDARRGVTVESFSDEFGGDAEWLSTAGGLAAPLIMTRRISCRGESLATSCA